MVECTAGTQIDMISLSFILAAVICRYFKIWWGCGVWLSASCFVFPLTLLNDELNVWWPESDIDLIVYRVPELFFIDILFIDKNTFSIRSGGLRGKVSPKIKNTDCSTYLKCCLSTYSSGVYCRVFETKALSWIQQNYMALCSWCLKEIRFVPFPSMFYRFLCM